MKVYVVCTGSGYYADSVWTTREAAIEEAKRLGDWEEDDPGRYVQEWEMNRSEQHFREYNALRKVDYNKPMFRGKP